MLKYSMFKDFAPLQEELNLRVETENARRRLTGLPLLPKVSAEMFFKMVLLAYELDTADCADQSVSSEIWKVLAPYIDTDSSLNTTADWIHKQLRQKSGAWLH